MGDVVNFDIVKNNRISDLQIMFFCPDPTYLRLLPLKAML